VSAPLPFSFRTYAGDDATEAFSVPFPFITREHVKVYINWDPNIDTRDDELENGVDFQWVSNTLINTTVAPEVGQNISVVRETPIDSQVVQWQTGSPPIAFDLNTADRQLLYVVQEILDRIGYSRESGYAGTAATAGYATTAGFATTAGRAKPDNTEPKVFYVRSDGSNTAAGRNKHTAYRDVEHALERAALQGQPWTVVLLDGLSTAGELDVPDNCTVMGANFQRRTIIQPTSGNAQRNVFRCGNGAHIVNIKFTGWQIDDFDNPTTGFGMVFRPGAVILPGGVPYGQNCVVSSSATDVPTPLPMDAEAGNPAHPRGGGCVLADASVLSAYSVYPNIMTWGFTPSSANGMGFVARNRGFINPVNAIGVGAHRHFMCLDGGRMVVSGSSSQFGDYSFWSEGFTQQIAPIKINPAVLATMPSAGSVIAAQKTALIDDMWSFLATSYGAGTWPTGYEALTRKDGGLFLDALGASLTHGFERPMLNFAEGMFRFNGVCVYTYGYHAAFKASWDRMLASLLASGALTVGAATMATALVTALKATMDNYWFEIGTGPAPTPVVRVRRKFRSLLTAINHQWTAPRAGVEFFRVPPARDARRIDRSIVQRNGGKVIFSGQDDSGNARFVGGLRIDARSGQLGGPPFDSAIRGRVTRAVLSRSY
jgi:hypothetical protein